MPRELPHFLLKNLGKAEPYKPKGRGGGKRPSDVFSREAHAQVLLSALDQLPNIEVDNLPGVYLEVTSRPNERLKLSSLDNKDMTLLKFDEGIHRDDYRQSATVFATNGGISKFRKKVEQFRTEDTKSREKDGQIVPGRPKNADLVQSIEAITHAALTALWRSPIDKFPELDGPSHWEVWLDPDNVDTFVANAEEYGLTLTAERLKFPEDIVLMAHATRTALANAIRKLGGVKALAAPTITAEFFDSQPVEEQAQWVDNLLSRTQYTPAPQAGYLTLLDTGVSRAHPLLAPALDIEDRHTADFGWSLEDIKGHGTKMGGLALFGDLTPLLWDASTVTINCKLESVKLIPDAAENPHYLLGAVTRNAVDVAEANKVARRTFTMAVTTDQDTPHDGAPTSWSSEIDQLAAGVSGKSDTKRLFVISAGNSNAYKLIQDDYLSVCDHADNEIESPAQAWNSLCIGAYTEKSNVPDDVVDKVLAPMGDLSPSSRTASWSSHWPLKPDVVFEGGNMLMGNMPPAVNHGWLSMLSTCLHYPQRSFDFMQDTSGATALAAKFATELWNEYPNLWPETIRGLMVSSARWTNQMRSHLPNEVNKGDYEKLFTRYGYGVPDLGRAMRSASNAVTLIVEDIINPYCLNEKKDGAIHNEMRIFELPWPVSELRRLQNSELTLRITLSTFIEPNPSEPCRGSKYRYASHNLRFKLNRAGENLEGFMSRISQIAKASVGPDNTEEDLWEFGSNRRDVGSLHIDELTCKASDMARRNLLAVHPVEGWWKSKSLLAEELPECRFALIVEIDGEHLTTDLYSEVKAVIENTAQVQSIIET